MARKRKLRDLNNNRKFWVFFKITVSITQRMSYHLQHLLSMNQNYTACNGSLFTNLFNITSGFFTFGKQSHLQFYSLLSNT